MARKAEQFVRESTTHTPLLAHATRQHYCAIGTRATIDHAFKNQRSARRALLLRVRQTTHSEGGGMPPLSISSLSSTWRFSWSSSE